LTVVWGSEKHPMRPIFKNNDFGLRTVWNASFPMHKKKGKRIGYYQPDHFYRVA